MRLTHLADNPVLCALHARQRDQRLAACRKRGLPSRGAAEAQMRSLLRREDYVENPELLNVYQCPRCFQWHVGRRRAQ